MSMLAMGGQLTVACASDVHLVHGGQVVAPEERRPSALIIAGDEQVGLVGPLQPAQLESSLPLSAWLVQSNDAWPRGLDKGQVHSCTLGDGGRHTCRRAVASSLRMKLATAEVRSGRWLRRAYSLTLALMNSENCTLSPGSPAGPRWIRVRPVYIMYDVCCLEAAHGSASLPHTVHIAATFCPD